MSLMLDTALENTGTRFRIFPQPRFLNPAIVPELVIISVPPKQMEPGPKDSRMFVVDAKSKLPYSDLFRPPYTGAFHPPVQPGPGGHFDHLDPNSREFLAATMYATVRRVLDIWEDYFGHQIEWHFEPDFGRLELIPLIEWDNAQSGYGFLEFGYGRKSNGGIDHERPYCENFDVLAHELGHSIIFSEVGFPNNPADPGTDYGGLHESAGDLVAIVSVLHFDSVVDRLLEATRGNLFTVNELDRVGELSESREIRVAFNYFRMSDVGKEPHERSLPLTGGIFDVFVEVYQKILVAKKLITDDLAKRSGQTFGNQAELEKLTKEFDKTYSGNEQTFKLALLEARDYLGALLAQTWGSLRPPNFLTYHDVLRAMLRADRTLFGGANQDTIRSCFAWRGISLIPGSVLLTPRSLRDCGLLPEPMRMAGDTAQRSVEEHAHPYEGQSSKMPEGEGYAARGDTAPKPAAPERKQKAAAEVLKAGAEKRPDKIRGAAKKAPKR
jgi:hypothetical protein